MADEDSGAGRVSHRRARVNGVELHWVEKGDGPLVLLMHGFPEFWWSWRKQIGPLSRRFRVVAVDMRGFNESEKPAAGYDTATLATDMRDLIDHLGGPAYVAGHDWGGIVAYQLAMDWPDRVRKLAILNAPHPDAWIRAWLTHAEQQRKSWYVFLNLLPDFPEENYKAQFRDGTVRLARVMPPEDVAVYREAFEKPGVATAAINYYREIVKEIPPPPSRDSRSHRLSRPRALGPKGRRARSGGQRHRGVVDRHHGGVLFPAGLALGRFREAARRHAPSAGILRRMTGPGARPSRR